eukprot:gb/GFBE01063549.1/.p1 GENE.gb/GFBE01063549.1/~~gb/GFBE01063549.1/.p1  ORF type:complete len:463 (+),score=78.49 gb/GFBE01063549.1/:1-1389(+)
MHAECMSPQPFGRMRSISWDGCDVSDIFVDIRDLPRIASSLQLPSLLDVEAGRLLACSLVAAASTWLLVCLLDWGCFMLGFPTWPVYAGACVAMALLLRGVPAVINAALRPPAPAAATRPLQQQSIGVRQRPRCVLIVFNPNSGTGRAKATADRCREQLLAAGIRVEEFRTQHVGHARLIADVLRPDHEAVIVVGGDGTVHEVMNGLHGHDIPLAIVPAGTGNGLATSLMQARLPSGQEGEGAGPSQMMLQEDPVDWATRNVLSGSIVRIDSLDIAAGRRRFDGAALVYFGLCAEVDIVAEPLRFLGSLRFDLAAVCQLLKLKALGPTTIEAVLQDGSNRTLNGPFLAIYIGNSQHWTDKMRAVPSAVLDDGLMELLVIKVTNRTNLLRGFLLLESGAHVNDAQARECIEILKVRSASFTFWDSSHSKPAPGIFNVDGEIFRHEGYVRVGCHSQSQGVFAGR